MPAIWIRINGCYSFKWNSQKNYNIVFWTSQRQIQKSSYKKDAIVHKRNIPKQPLCVNLQVNPRLHAPLRSLKSPSSFHIILQNPLHDQKLRPTSSFLQINHHQQNHKSLPSWSKINPFWTFDARSASLPLSGQSTLRTLSVENTILKIIRVGQCRTIRGDLRMGQIYQIMHEKKQQTWSLTGLIRFCTIRWKQQFKCLCPTDLLIYRILPRSHLRTSRPMHWCILKILWRT